MRTTMLLPASGIALAVAVGGVAVSANRSSAPASPQPPVVLTDDAGWCWFQDERAIVVGRTLVAGTVAAGRKDPGRRGAIEVTGFDLDTGAAARFRLDATPIPGPYDDHNAPALVVRSDGRLLAAFAGHGSENRIRYRVSVRPGDPSAWGDEHLFVPSPSSRITYSNLHRLVAEHGRIYDFYRGLDDRFKPSVAWSDDDGVTWTSGGLLIDVPAAVRHRPYAKYASNAASIHVVYTEGHPRDYDNSLYHAFYRDGRLWRSDGASIAPLARGLARPEDGTRVFRGDPATVPWCADLELDSQGRPFVAFSVQKDSAGLPVGQGGTDHRYRLARWMGTSWQDVEIAYAGSRLYAGEDDYTGGIALVPGDPTVVYLSTNVDPSSGAPLVSRTDGRRHHEIFRGETADGRAWRFTALTRDSVADNIRPLVPRAAGEPVVLWLRGSYRAYTDYALELVALVSR